jgi:hypothetical protein
MRRHCIKVENLWILNNVRIANIENLWTFIKPDEWCLLPRLEVSISNVLGDVFDLVDPANYTPKSQNAIKEDAKHVSVRSCPNDNANFLCLPRECAIVPRRR